MTVPASLSPAELERLRVRIRQAIEEQIDQLGTHPTDALVLERLPNDTYVWLRPAHD